MPLGRSTAITGTPAALIASIIARAAPSTGRSRPAPNSASTISSAPCERRGRRPPRPAPASAAAASAASPLRLVAIAQQQQPDRIAALGQDARADKAVAAVVAGPGHDADQRRAGGCRAPPRRRPPGRRSPSAGCPASRRDRQAVGLGHLGGGQQLDHGACDSIGGGLAPTTRRSLGTLTTRCAGCLIVGQWSLHDCSKRLPQSSANPWKAKKIQPFSAMPALGTDPAIEQRGAAGHVSGRPGR